MNDNFEKLKTHLKYSESKKRYIFSSKVLIALGISPQDAYDYLHPELIKYCPICGAKTKFRNFSMGYSEACPAHKTIVAHQRSLDSTERRYGTRDPLSIKDGRKRGNAKCINDPDVADKRQRTCMQRYGVANTFACPDVQRRAQHVRAELLQDPEYKAKISSKVMASHRKHYGAFYTQTEEYKNRHRATRRLTRLRAEADKSMPYKQYRRLVDNFTRELDVSGLANADKRGLAGVNGAWQLDHLYSVRDGYLNGIPAHIIGSIVNVEFIPWIDNIRKHAKSSISKDELLERYRRYVED